MLQRQRFPAHCIALLFVLGTLAVILSRYNGFDLNVATMAPKTRLPDFLRAEIKEESIEMLQRHVTVDDLKRPVEKLRNPPPRLDIETSSSSGRSKHDHDQPQSSVVGKTSLPQPEDERYAERIATMNVSTPSTLKQANQSALEALSDLVLRSFYAIQYPINCQEAKVLVCNLGDNRVGFTARVHEAIVCHLIAYALNRTLLITNTHLGLANDGWSEKHFQTMDPCKLRFKESTLRDIKDIALWKNYSAMDNTFKVLKYQHRWGRNVRGPIPAFLPGTIPGSIAKVITKLHSSPKIWFIGQSAAFLLRLKPDFQSEFDSVKHSLGFRSPIVGLHIRHGNKLGNSMYLAEAEYIKEDLFMKQIGTFYDHNHPGMELRPIYISSDDVKAREKLVASYPRYKFLYIEGVAAKAQKYDSASNYEAEVLQGIILDVIFLARTDFVVCTLSSNVGRLVHELRQAIHPVDQTDTLVSMDRQWFYNWPGYMYDGRTWLIATADVDYSNNREFVINIGGKSIPFISHLSGDLLWTAGKVFQLNDTRAVYLVQSKRTLQEGLVSAHNVYEMPEKPNYLNPMLKRQTEQLKLANELE